MTYLREAVEVSPCGCEYQALAISNFSVMWHMYPVTDVVLALHEYVKQSPHITINHDFGARIGTIESYHFGIASVTMYDHYIPNTVEECYSKIMSENKDNKPSSPIKHDLCKKLFHLGLIVSGKINPIVSESVGTYYLGLSPTFNSLDGKLHIEELSLVPSPQFCTYPVVGS